jgi:hypothetical protein
MSTGSVFKLQTRVQNKTYVIIIDRRFGLVRISSSEYYDDGSVFDAIAGYIFC